MYDSIMTNADDTIKLFTFELIDGRKVTYAGKTEKLAFWHADDYHPRAVAPRLGVPAQPCTCASRRPSSTRQGGFFTCTECAGYLG